jgi:paraquat-inducible protein B
MQQERFPMSDQKAGSNGLGGVPEAVVQERRRRFSIVWVVPLVALLIGGWLVYRAYSEKGPTVTITFKTAEGLEAGKTSVKYKDVQLGQVSAIELSEDLSKVLVTAQLVKQAERFISGNTRFWVERARVGATGVSGIGTIFSGAYIELDPGEPGGEPETHFEGLEVPPVVTSDLPGRHFLLNAAERGSIEIGSPVYYRDFAVGQVVSNELGADGRRVIIKIFVNDPYHEYVYTNTRFWNAAGVDFKMDAQGIRVDTQSLTSILIGGIAFGLPEDETPAKLAEENRFFALHKNYDRALTKQYRAKSRWLLYFRESVRGLDVGAPVEIFGIRVGEVVDVQLEYDASDDEVRVPVVVETEPGRMNIEGGDLSTGENRHRALDSLIAKGFRAQLKTGSLVTGQQLIAIDLFPDASPAAIRWDAKPYPEFPTVPTPLEEIETKITRIVDKIDQLPLDQIGNDLRDAVQNVKALTASPEISGAVRQLNATLQESRLLIEDLRTRVTPRIEAALENAQSSLAGAQAMLAGDSPLQVKLKTALDEISTAARSLRLLADYLERHPEALLRGKGKER